VNDTAAKGRSPWEDPEQVSGTSVHLSLISGSGCTQSLGGLTENWYSYYWLFRSQLHFLSSQTCLIGRTKQVICDWWFMYRGGASAPVFLKNGRQVLRIYFVKNHGLTSFLEV
jgi:hypothetical protein